MAGLSGVINRLKVETIPGYRRSSRTSAPSAEAEARLKSRQKYRNQKYAYQKHGDSLLGMMLGFKDPDAMNKHNRNNRGNASTGSSSASNGEDINMPPLEQGKPGTVVTKPTVAAIIRQLNAIAVVASQITSALQAHQAALESRAAASREAVKENALEHRQDATMENSNEGASSLTPIGTAMDKLNKAILTFIKVLKHKENQQTANELLDDIDGLGGGGRRRFRFGRGGGRAGGFARFGLGLAGAGLTAATLSSMVPSNLATAPGKYTPSGQAPVSGVKELDLANVSNVGPAPASEKSSTTDDITGALTPSVKTAGEFVDARTDLSQNDIAKMAGPLIAEPFNQNTIKSIPISKASGSVDETLRKIISGSPQRAGVDPSSGLTAPLAGIPALATSITNDIYRKLYNINPDSDPLAAQRLADIRKGVDTAFADTLRPLIAFSPEANSNANRDLSADATSVASPSPTSQQPGGAPPANADGTPTSSDSSTSVGSGQAAAAVVTPDASVGPSSQPSLAQAPVTSQDAQQISSSQATGQDMASPAVSTNTNPDATAVSSSIDKGTSVETGSTAAAMSGGSPSINIEPTATQQSTNKPPATNAKFSLDRFVHDMFAWDTPYKTKAEKQALKEAQRLQALSDERDRKARFGRAGILQSGVSTSHTPNIVPSVKPAVPHGLVTSGVGDVPSPDFPLYEKYHQHLHFEGLVG